MSEKKARQLKLITKIQFIILDIFLLTLSASAYVWVINKLGQSVELNQGFVIISILVGITIMIYILFGFYRMLLLHFGFEDALRIVAVIVVKNLLFAIFFQIFKNIIYVRWQVFLLGVPVEIMVIMFPRLIPRGIRYLKGFIRRPEGEINTLIVGAGSGGSIVLKEIKQNPELNYKVVGFIDDDQNKVGSNLNGIKIYGPMDNIVQIIGELDVKEVIIAIANLSPKRLSELVNELTSINVKSKKIVVLSEVSSARPIQLVDINIEDLLNRHPVELDNEGLKRFIKGNTVLVTGGGGSIGSELCRQIVLYEPEKLVIFDIYENTTYDIQMELKRKFYKDKSLKEPIIEVIIGSVYNKERLDKVFNEFKPDIVFHAAAYKHVPLMEDSPVEAIRTNVIGTYNVATLSDVHKVKKMVLVSTDKAVRPTNIMGATKRYAEHIIQYQNSIAKNTSYSAVRFGNVLGSNGSVIPLFTKQIADGGPVTVTHKEITRYFMTIPEAVSLILLSGVLASGGEIFVLDMGEPVKILDLAERMIRLAGYKPYEEIGIEFTGLRPGEKLYEEILINTNLDIHKPTENSKIFIENEEFLSFTNLQIEKIINEIDSFTADEIKGLIKKIIVTYKPNT